ncbi:hypothetical protein, partial [Cupriavidus sp. L7L]|uniref:hypothetical protein n=1 Tax=Cupriavidus sp. L7L TaxID=2546443 RepID=UPI001A9D3D7A
MMKPIAAALVSTVILAGCASPASLKPQGVFLLSPASLAPQGVDLFKELQDMRISAAKVAIQSKLDQKNYFA